MLFLDKIAIYLLEIVFLIIPYYKTSSSCIQEEFSFNDRSSSSNFQFSNFYVQMFVDQTDLNYD